jgi:hypothetical protein
MIRAALARGQVGWKLAGLILLTNLLTLAVTIGAIRITSREARKASCSLVLLQIKAFDENDPTRLTPTGRDLAQAWREAARVYGCERK